MQVIIKKRALNSIIKTMNFVESQNTQGSGDRWAEKVREKIRALAASKVEFAICGHHSLAKFQYRCYAYKEWIIAFRIYGDKFTVHKFVLGSTLS